MELKEAAKKIGHMTRMTIAKTVAKYLNGFRKNEENQEGHFWRGQVVLERKG